MEYWLWLRGIKGLGPIIEKRLLEHFKTPKSIYEAHEDELLSIMGVGKVLAASICFSHCLDSAHRSLEEMGKKNIKLLTYDDPLYPIIAKDYPEAPTLLYYRGLIKANIEGVGIVGSRRCSNYGKRVAIEAAEFLAEQDIPVISGMAKGIDGYAHTACLKRDGYTIAFLGSGVDICYPSEHISLMEAIIENGAVISEHPPGTTAHSEFFPRRNALIASWSKKILVAEAANRSGALITAELAKELKLNPNTKPKINVELSITEEKILSCITEKAKTIEEIGVELGMEQVELIEEISIMELEGKIRDISGGRYLG